MLSMIELKDGLILGKSSPKKEVSFNYEKGEINYIDYSSFYIYKFLKLKDIALDKGEFFVDGVKIYPAEDEDKTLFFLSVNSLIKVDLCFVTDKSEKKEKVQFVQQQLLELKSFPVTTENDKNLKIAAIFEKIAAISPSYVLVDLNDETNGTSIELMNQLNQYKGVLTIIVLNQKPKVVKEEKPIVEDQKDEEKPKEEEPIVEEPKKEEKTIAEEPKEEEPKKKEHAHEDSDIDDLLNSLDLDFS